MNKPSQQQQFTKQRRPNLIDGDETGRYNLILATPRIRLDSVGMSG